MKFSLEDCILLPSVTDVRPLGIIDTYVNETVAYSGIYVLAIGGVSGCMGLPEAANRFGAIRVCPKVVLDAISCQLSAKKPKLWLEVPAT
jgi:hypothetical protein